MPVRSSVAAALALSLAAQAHASVVTYSTTETFSGTDSGGYELQRFDPSLGTLTAISLRIHGEVEQGVYVEAGVDANGDDIFVLYKSLVLSFPDGIEVNEDGLFDKSFQPTSLSAYIGYTPLIYSGSNSGSGEFSTEIRYTYDQRVSAVPLPASLPLVGLACAALGWVRARRLAAA